MTEPVPFEIRMAALREHFTVRARREGEELKLLAARIGADQSVNTKIGKIAHGLAGSAAIFGMPVVSNDAAVLEEAIAAGAAEADIAAQSLALAHMLTALGYHSSI